MGRQGCRQSNDRFNHDKDDVYNVKDERRQDVKDFVEALTSNQFSKLAEFLQKIPSVKKRVEWCCSTCEANNEMELRGLQSFFT